MVSKEYSVSLLDPLSTFNLLEEISFLLCIDRPEFATLFGEDHRRRVEEDARREEEIEKEKKVEKVNSGEREVESKKKLKVEEENKKKKKEERGLLTVVAATSSGELVAHACIIASPGQVMVSLYHCFSWSDRAVGACVHPPLSSEARPLICYLSSPSF